MAPKPWSTEEVEATVAAYFAMLRLELAGLPYQKSEHNERLRRLLNNRTKAAVEYKFQNISAVLVNHQQVYIRGYLPAQNYQRALEAAVLEWLNGGNDLVDVVETSPVLYPPAPTTTCSSRWRGNTVGSNSRSAFPSVSARRCRTGTRRHWSRADGSCQLPTQIR